MDIGNENGKRYYWLKLKRDFFKRHDIRIIESMPNGKDYILFYLKLLCESVDHDGNLRFNEQIPYNEDMLATITNTNIDIVRSAIKVFSQLQMMEILDDGTYFMHEVQKMIGSAADNDNANRQRRYRERKKALALQDRNAIVTKNNESKNIEKEIDIEKDNKKEKDKKKMFVPPTVDEVEQYVIEKGYHIDPIAFVNFYQSKGWKVGKNPMVNWKSAVVTWEQKRKNDTSSKKESKRNIDWDELTEWARKKDQGILEGDIVYDQ